MTEWTQDTSELYRQLSAIAVPARAEQIATLLALIPYSADEAFRVVELASGEGYLAQAILTAFPQATLLALDFEELMRQKTTDRLSAFHDRVRVAPFDMLQTDWFDQLKDADVVVSSLCVHHLDDAGKQRLFGAVQQRLSEQGTLLIADLVHHTNPQAQALFAATWDQMAEAASIERTLARDLFQMFDRERWNWFRHPDDDDYDKPSSLFAQLQWLRDAGFVTVDCFWMQAGHAIFGGYKHQRQAHIAFDSALEIARDTLKT